MSSDFPHFGSISSNQTFPDFRHPYLDQPFDLSSPNESTINSISAKSPPNYLSLSDGPPSLEKTKSLKINTNITDPPTLHPTISNLNQYQESTNTMQQMQQFPYQTQFTATKAHSELIKHYNINDMRSFNDNNDLSNDRRNNILEEYDMQNRNEFFNYYPVNINIGLGNNYNFPSVSNNINDSLNINNIGFGLRTNNYNSNYNYNSEINNTSKMLDNQLVSQHPPIDWNKAKGPNVEYGNNHDWNLKQNLSWNHENATNIINNHNNINITHNIQTDFHNRNYSNVKSEENNKNQPNNPNPLPNQTTKKRGRPIGSCNKKKRRLNNESDSEYKPEENKNNDTVNSEDEGNKDVKHQNLSLEKTNQPNSSNCITIGDSDIDMNNILKPKQRTKYVRGLDDASKKERRRLQNRLAAARSRARKNAMVVKAQKQAEKLKQLKKDNKILQEKLQNLEKENELLKQRLSSYESI